MPSHSISQHRDTFYADYLCPLFFGSLVPTRIQLSCEWHTQFTELRMAPIQSFSPVLQSMGGGSWTEGLAARRGMGARADTSLTTAGVECGRGPVLLVRSRAPVCGKGRGYARRALDLTQLRRFAEIESNRERHAQEVLRGTHFKVLGDPMDPFSRLEASMQGICAGPLTT